MKIIDFIGVKAEFDNGGQHIFGVNANQELQMIAEVRGWGAMQNMVKEENGGIFDIEKAYEFQDKLGEWIAEAITEKLERERK